MASFKEIRELLLLSLEINTIDEEEFLLLSEEFKSVHLLSNEKSWIESNRTADFVVIYILQGLIFRTVPFIYLIRIENFESIQVYRKNYVRNILKILLSRGRHVHLKTYRQNKQCRWDCRCFETQRNIFLGIFNQPSHARVPIIDAFSFSRWIMLLEKNYSLKAFKENTNILLTGSFPQKPLKTTAHGLPKISLNLLLQRPNLRQKVQKKVSFFQTLVLNKIKWAQKRQRLLWILTFTRGRQINRCHVLNAMWTTSMTCAEVAGFVITLPVGVHSARRLGCLRSLIAFGWCENLNKYNKSFI